MHSLDQTFSWISWEGKAISIRYNWPRTSYTSSDYVSAIEERVFNTMWDPPTVIIKYSTLGGMNGSIRNIK